jgi:hypothetical protein
VKKLIALAALAAALGCNQSSPTTAPPSRENESDIKIRTPGAKVDVQGKGEGKGVDVNVERKKNNP